MDFIKKFIEHKCDPSPLAIGNPDHALKKENPAYRKR